MSMRGKWRVVETPEYDMAGAGSYILFDEDGGEFALDCLTGSFQGRCDGDAVEFTWEGNDEMEEANGHGWGRAAARRLPRRRDLPRKWGLDPELHPLSETRYQGQVVAMSAVWGRSRAAPNAGRLFSYSTGGR
jgi:hypothetical protein